MSYDLQHKVIYFGIQAAVVVGKDTVVGRQITTISAEEDGAFIITVNEGPNTLEDEVLGRTDIVRVTPEMLGLMIKEATKEEIGNE